MLIESNDKMNIVEVPIKIVYDSKENHETHFELIDDLITLYKMILKYSLFSIAATIIDFIVFTIAMGVWEDVWRATAIGRMMAAFINFILNRNVVFCSNGKILEQVLAYLLFVAMSGTVSAYIVSSLSKILSLDVMAIKIMAGAGLFFFNYYVQHVFIFSRRKREHING